MPDVSWFRKATVIFAYESIPTFAIVRVINYKRCFAEIGQLFSVGRRAILVEILVKWDIVFFYPVEPGRVFHLGNVQIPTRTFRVEMD